jgi:response regulator RpfG family c-di-GMP phosphodiesterase
VGISAKLISLVAGIFWTVGLIGIFAVSRYDEIAEQSATTEVEFLSKIRKMYPDTVRMLTSAHEDLAATREAINLGAIFKFIEKPWDHDQLKAMLEEAFQSYRRAHKKIS